jgi:hypothetical protein
MDIELIEPPSTELTVQDRACLALGSDKTRMSLYELATKSAHLVEVKNKAARDEVHRAAMVLAEARIAIRKTGKAARDDATKFSKAVITEEDSLVVIVEPEEKRLLAMRDAWDAIAAAEKAERERIERDKAAALQSAIDWIKEHAFAAHGKSSAAIADMVAELTAVDITLEQYGERTGEAELARMTTLERMGSLHAAALAMEARAEELRLEREAFEAQRAEQVRAEQEAARARAGVEALAAAQREAVEAAARAEAERIEAEARAVKEKADEERREADRKAQAERDEAERVAAEARAHADREAARERAEQERAAQALRDLQAAATRRLHDAADYMLRTLQGVRMDAGFASLSDASQVSVKTAIELAGE